MGFFSFVQDIAIDLGTANTIIISDDKIVVDEPSVIALDRRTDKMIAVGNEAKMMYEKTHENIRTIRPLRDGVIADFSACEQMMRGLIKMVHVGNRLFSPSLRMVIGVPSGSTEVELRAVRDSAEHANGRDIYLIFEPMAAAIGIGIDVEAPEGNMIVDIGGGSTEIAVISLGGIVSNNSIRVAGDDLTADIQEYMYRQHNVKVSERMAERIKINVGSALTDLGDEAPFFHLLPLPHMHAGYLATCCVGDVHQPPGIHDEAHALSPHGEGAKDGPQDHRQQQEGNGRQPHPAHGGGDGQHHVQLLRRAQLVEGRLAEELALIFHVSPPPQASHPQLCHPSGPQCRR